MNKNESQLPTIKLSVIYHRFYEFSNKIRIGMGEIELGEKWLIKFSNKVEEINPTLAYDMAKYCARNSVKWLDDNFDKLIYLNLYLHTLLINQTLIIDDMY